MPTLQSSVGPLSYSDDGAGPPVLLLHANLHDRTDFAPVLDDLIDGRRVIALDWPGHGDSSTPDRALGAAALGDLAVEVVDDLDLTDVIVIGNSVGGYAACRIALERPGRVAGVVLVNTGGFTPHTPFSRAFCALLGRPAALRRIAPFFARAYMRPKTRADRDIITRVAARSRTPEGARTAAALWRSFTEPAHDLRISAKRITVPVLITWSTKDLTSPVRWGRLVADTIPTARFSTFAAGHVVFSSVPEAWLREVLPFLSSVHGSVHRGNRPTSRG